MESASPSRAASRTTPTTTPPCTPDARPPPPPSPPPVGPNPSSSSPHPPPPRRSSVHRAFLARKRKSMNKPETPTHDLMPTPPPAAIPNATTPDAQRFLSPITRLTATTNTTTATAALSLTPVFRSSPMSESLEHDDVQGAEGQETDEFEQGRIGGGGGEGEREDESQVIDGQPVTDENTDSGVAGVVTAAGTNTASTTGNATRSIFSDPEPKLGAHKTTASIMATPVKPFFAISSKPVSTKADIAKPDRETTADKNEAAQSQPPDTPPKSSPRRHAAPVARHVLARRLRNSLGRSIRLFDPASPALSALPSTRSPSATYSRSSIRSSTRSSTARPDKPPSPFVPLAVRIMKWGSDTPERWKPVTPGKPQHKVFETPKPTRPVSPKLRTSMRRRRESLMTTDDKEAEACAAIPAFKAHPVPQSVLKGPAPIRHDRRHTRNARTPEFVRRYREKRAKQLAAQREAEASKDAAAQPSRLSRAGSASRRLSTSSTISSLSRLSTGTSATGWSYASNASAVLVGGAEASQLAKHRQMARLARILAEDKKMRTFHAKPAPSTTRFRSALPQVPKAAPTKAHPFHFKLDDRPLARSHTMGEASEPGSASTSFSSAFSTPSCNPRHRRASTFVPSSYRGAAPVLFPPPILSRRPFVPRKSTRGPLRPENLQGQTLATATRASERQEFDRLIAEKYRLLQQRQLQEKEAQELKARREIRKSMVSKAIPIPENLKTPFQPHQSRKRLTSPKSPKFVIEERLMKRRRV